MSFIESIKDRARSNPKKIVFPESGDIRVLQACEEIIKEKFAEVILVGDKDEIIKNSNGLNLEGVEFINPPTYSGTEKMIDDLFEMRKSKGLTREQATDLIVNNPLYFAVMLVNNSTADGMVAGAINATGDVLRPSLQILKTAPGTKLVSAFFIMCVPNWGENDAFLFSDCGLNQNPNAEELGNIAISSAKTYEILTGNKPIVAMLSHSTKGSAKHADVDKVVEATKIAKELDSTLELDGEFQLDAAIIPAIGKSKAPDSNVAGKANVLVFPDLDAGNIGYKLVERFAKANAYGPVLQGVRKPVNDLSRGCSKDDIVGVCAITVVQAQENENK